MTYSLTISIEMKDRQITGPLLAEIVGKALKDERNVKEVVVICRSVDAPKYEAKHKLRITFIEDEAGNCSPPDWARVRRWDSGSAD